MGLSYQWDWLPELEAGRHQALGIELAAFADHDRGPEEGIPLRHHGEDGQHREGGQRHRKAFSMPWLGS